MARGMVRSACSMRAARRAAVLGAAAVTFTGLGLVGGAAAAQQPAEAPAHPATTGAAALPVGASPGFPFGYAIDEGAKVSLLPPNDKDVNQGRVGAAPKLGPWKINLAAGIKAWPNACNLTNLAQLHELFPAITGIQGKPVGQRGELLGGSNTPTNVQCTWHLKTTFQPAGYPLSWVEVSLEEIDSDAPSIWSENLAQQKSTAKKYPYEYANYPNLEHGVKCFDDGTDLQCLKGDASYWIDGQKVTDGDHSDADNAVFIDQVEIPLAEVIASELSTTP